MPLFAEKPQKFDAFCFKGGGDSAREFIIWANERGFTAAWIPELDYKTEFDSETVMHIQERIQFTRRGYIKGDQVFGELLPERWFVLQPEGEPVIMTKAAFAGRFEPA